MKPNLCLALTRTLAAIALAMLITGCSTTPKVHTQPKTGTDYTRYHTFALLPLPAAGPASDPGLMLRVAEPAREAVVQSLQAKGLKPADREQADIAVNLRGESLPKVEVTDWGYTRMAHTRYGSVPVQVGEQDVRAYEERTLVVEIYDTRAKELVWVGWSKREASGEVKVEKLQEAIRNILAQYPPATPAASTGK